jgi:D-alanyl-D-alanine carboxypeptidase
MQKNKIRLALILIMVLAITGVSFMVKNYLKQNGSQEKSAAQPTKTTSASSSENKGYPIKIAAGSEDAELLMVVNKKHPLPADYNPYNGGLSPATTQAKDELITAMQRAGFDVGTTVSGFRDYNYQKTLYDGYVASEGQAAADAVSARPGYSEHQSGLAFDLRSGSGGLFAAGNSDSQAEQWLLDHAAKYGLIVRYPEGKTAITGYSNEEWHMRYVGVKAATFIAAHGLTLEQYTGVPGGDYNTDASADVPALSEYTAEYANRLDK